ncbi:MAG: hypothetical protein U0L73_11745 [Ruminococcus bromii]|nr:hypothetical protein [Ruminococcus bromii]
MKLKELIETTTDDTNIILITSNKKFITSTKASALKSQCQSETQNAFDNKMLDCPVVEISVGINDTSSYPYSTNCTRNGKLTIVIETER